MEAEEITIFPERRVVYATFWQRIAAGFLDMLVLAIPNYIILRFVGGQDFITEIIHGQLYASSFLGQFITVIIEWAYQAGLEQRTGVWHSRTSGARSSSTANSSPSFQLESTTRSAFWEQEDLG